MNCIKDIISYPWGVGLHAIYQAFSQDIRTTGQVGAGHINDCSLNRFNIIQKGV
jgi:hypothetical protein